MIATIRAIRQRRWSRATLLAAATVGLLFIVLVIRGISFWPAAASSYSQTILGDSPSFYYRLDESAGPTMTDSSSGTRNATYQSGIGFGATGALAGESDTAISPNGNVAGTYASGIGEPTGATARTVEGWIRTIDGNNQDLVSWGATNTHQMFGLLMSGGGNQIEVATWDDNKWFNTPRPVNDGNWHLLDISYDGNLTVNAYLDGQSLGSQTLSGALNTSQSQLMVGGSVWCSCEQIRNTNNGLDEVAVYPSTLSATQIANHFTASGDSRPTAPSNVTATAGANQATVSWSASSATVPSGQTAVLGYVVTAYRGTAALNATSVPAASTSATLSGLVGGASYTFQVYAYNSFGIGGSSASSAVVPTGTASTYASTVLADGASYYYRAGDSGSLMTDSAGGHHALAGSGMSRGISGALLSDPDTAVAPNGNVAGIYTAGTGEPTGATPRTVEGWVRTIDGGQQALVSWGGGGDGQYFSLIVGYNGTFGVATRSNDLWFAASRAINDGNWHLLDVTYDGNVTATAYVDGQVAGAQTWGSSLNTGQGALQVGGLTWCTCNSVRNTNNGLDEVAVYPSALSAGQIANHFNASGDSRPTAPSNVTATAGANQATVSWGAATASVPSGQTAVQGYVVTAFSGATSRNATSVVASSTSATLSGLQGNVAYTFQVTALNSFGVGAAGASSAVTPSGNANTYASTILGDSPSFYYRLGDTGPRFTDSSAGGSAHAAPPGPGLSTNSSSALVSDSDGSVAPNGNTVGTYAAGTGTPLGATARTVEAWARTTAGNQQTLLSFGNGGGHQWYALMINNGSSFGVVTQGDDLWFTTARPINDGNWHLFTITYNGNLTASAYLDGQLVGSQQWATPPNTLQGGLNLGMLGWCGCDQMAGNSAGLDEVAVYPSALSATQIANHFNASGDTRPTAPGNVIATAGVNQAAVSWSASSATVPSGQTTVQGYVVTAFSGATSRNATSVPASSTTATLSGLQGGVAYTFQVTSLNSFGAGAAGVSPAVTPTGSATTYASTILGDSPSFYYRLGDMGPRFTDSSVGGSAHHALTGPGLSTNSSSALVSDSDGSVAPNGNTVGTYAAGVGTPLGSTARTMEAWARTTAGNQQTLVSVGNGGQHQWYALMINNASSFGVATQGDDLWFTTSLPINDGNWHLFDITYDGNVTATAYLDGHLVGSQHWSSPVNTLQGGLNLGMLGWCGCDQMAGNSAGLDELALYPSALSATQIANHFTASGETSPTAPSNVTASAGPNQATATWTPSTANVPLGQHAVQGYVVTAYRGAIVAGSTSVSESATSGTVPDLIPGVRYTLQVNAFNGVGSGPASAAPNAVIPVPGRLVTAGTLNEYPAGTPVHNVVAVDLARNGKVDIVESGDSGIVVFLGNGDGTFRAAVSYPVSGGANQVVTADINHDGNPDILVGLSSGAFAVLLGNGDGTLQAATTYAAPGAVSGLAVGDVNGDGKLDVVTADGANNSVGRYSVFMGNGDGTFLAPATYTSNVVNHGILSVALADLNGDGKLDLVAGDVDYAADPVGVEIRMGNGDGTFGPATFISTGNTYQSVGQVTAVDVNGDGNIDIMAGQLGCGYADGNDTQILLGNGSGGFSAPHGLGDGCTRGQAVVDINGDGFPDIITGNGNGPFDQNTSHVSVYLGLGDGTYMPPVNFPLPLAQGTNGVALGDFNGDRKPDIATANYTSSDASVIINTSPWAPVGGPIRASELPRGFCAACLAKTQGMWVRPVDTGTGVFWHTFSDLTVPGRGQSLAFDHTYNSNIAGTNGPLGYGWTSSYNMSLSIDPSTGNVTVVQDSGSRETFNLVRGAYTAPPRVLAAVIKNGDGSYALTLQARNKYVFSATGALLSEQDLNGYTTAFAYNASGQLVTVTDPAGRQLTLTYSGSHLSTVRDPLNRTVSFAYNDGNGNLTDVTDVNTGVEHFTYDGGHRLLTMTDPRGGVVSNNYDGSGRVTWQTDAMNRKTTFVYAGTPSLSGSTTITDPQGNVTFEQYLYGERVGVIKGYGTSSAATTVYFYDPATAALATVYDGNGNVTTSTYDANANPLVTTDPLGRQTARTYDGLGDLTSMTDASHVTTTYTYDASGNLLTRSRPLVGSSPAQTQTTTYRYSDPAHPGDLTSMTDPAAKTWAYTFDAYGNKTSSTDPLGNIATTTYNVVGWVTSTVSPKGNVAGCACAAQYTTTYSYADPGTGSIDGFGDVRVITDPLGHRVLKAYDPDRNIVSQTDGNGNTTTYVLDADNEVTAVNRADATVTKTDYNADGTVRAQTDGKGNAILTYGYDVLARVISITDALGNMTQYTYDQAGNRVTQRDPGGSCASPAVGCTQFTYDAANQLTGINYSDGSTPNVTGITYNADGQRTGMTDGTGTWTWQYDSLHRVTSVTEGSNGTVSYQYDLRGLMTSITYPGPHTVTRSYDDAGRWTATTDWLHNTTTFGYDPNSELTTQTFPANTAGVYDQDSYGFNAAGEVTSFAVTKNAPPLPAAPLLSASYARDANGQLTSDSSQPPSSGGYGYTALNQLCYASASSSLTCANAPSPSGYKLDAADNLVQDGSVQQAFNAADEICWSLSNTTSSNSCGTAPSGASTFAYDLRGNRTATTPSSGAGTVLGYDQANRMISWQQGSSTAAYTYNGDGLRMSKRVNGVTENFSWELTGGLPLALVDGAMQYVYGPGGLPLEQLSGNTVLNYHHDQLGSTRLMTDATGVAQATFTYGPYGGIAASTGNVINPFLYVGQYSDGETGSYYLRARYYDPTTAQFLSRDPAVATTRSPYGYVAGNPLNAADPNGLKGGPGMADVIRSLPPGPLCFRNPFGGDNDNGDCHTLLSTSQGAFGITICALTWQALTQSRNRYAEPGGTPTQIITRTDAGADGGISRHILTEDSAGTTSVTHQVEVNGDIVHQHTTYIGKYGGRRDADTFPDEWTR